MKKRILLMFFAASVLAGQASTTGDIRGTVLDETGKPMPYANVQLKMDSTFISGAQTDDNGIFIFSSVNSGKYLVKVQYTGYHPSVTHGIEINAEQSIRLTVKMKLRGDLPPVEISGRYIPPVVSANFGGVTFITSTQLTELPVSGSDVIIAALGLISDVKVTDDGKGIYSRGSRRDASAFVVDGCRLLGSAAVPGISIGGMSVLSGGVPAEYGDLTGGLVVITTKDYMMGMQEKEDMYKRYYRRLQDEEIAKKEKDKQLVPAP